MKGIEHKGIAPHRGYCWGVCWPGKPQPPSTLVSLRWALLCPSCPSFGCYTCRTHLPASKLVPPPSYLEQTPNLLQSLPDPPPPASLKASGQCLMLWAWSPLGPLPLPGPLPGMFFPRLPPPVSPSSVNSGIGNYRKPFLTARPPPPGQTKIDTRLVSLHQRTWFVSAALQ